MTEQKEEEMRKENERWKHYQSGEKTEEKKK